jgi:glycosidase
VQNGDAEQRPSDPDFRPYNPGKPDEASFRLALLGHAIQTTYAGGPMIYYGTELGMWGADDPTCRKPTPWPDKGRNLSPDDAPNLRHREALRGWLRLRQDRDAGEILRLGTTRHLDAGSDDVFAFERCLAGERVVVVANRGAAIFENRALLGRSLRVPGVSAKAWLVKADGAVRELR